MGHGKWRWPNKIRKSLTGKISMLMSRLIRSRLLMRTYNIFMLHLTPFHCFFPYLIPITKNNCTLGVEQSRYDPIDPREKVGTLYTRRLCTCTYMIYGSGVANKCTQKRCRSIGRIQLPTRLSVAITYYHIWSRPSRVLDWLKTTLDSRLEDLGYQIIWNSSVIYVYGDCLFRVFVLGDWGHFSYVSLF